MEKIFFYQGVLKRSLAPEPQQNTYGLHYVITLHQEELINYLHALYPQLKEDPIINGVAALVVNTVSITSKNSNIHTQFNNILFGGRCGDAKPIMEKFISEMSCHHKRFDKIYSSVLSAAGPSSPSPHSPQSPAKGSSPKTKTLGI